MAHFPAAQEMARSQNDGDSKEVPAALRKMNPDVQGYDLIGRVIACIAEGNRHVALVVGYRESIGCKEHLLYNMGLGLTEEADLATREWELDFSVDLTGLISQRIVVRWPGEYAEGEEGEDTITDGMIPFEAFVVRASAEEGGENENKWRILYTYKPIFEDRNLADSESNWAAVETTQSAFKGLPIVSWSSKPNRLTPVLDKKHHWKM